MKRQWWTWWPGDYSNPCSKHKSLKAAEKAARICEANGGRKHKLYEVREVPRRGKRT